MVFVVLLIMLEAAVTVDVFVNQDWEKVLYIKNFLSNVFVKFNTSVVFSSCDIYVLNHYLIHSNMEIGIRTSQRTPPGVLISSRILSGQIMRCANG